MFLKFKNDIICPDDELFPINLNRKFQFTEKMDFKIWRNLINETN